MKNFVLGIAIGSVGMLAAISVFFPPVFYFLMMAFSRP